MTKKKERKLLEEIDQYLKLKGISGILYIPKIGLKALYKNEGIRLRIIEYALLEAEIDKQTREKTAEIIVDEGAANFESFKSSSTIKSITKKTTEKGGSNIPLYIG